MPQSQLRLGPSGRLAQLSPNRLHRPAAAPPHHKSTPHALHQLHGAPLSHHLLQRRPLVGEPLPSRPAARMRLQAQRNGAQLLVAGPLPPHQLPPAPAALQHDGGGTHAAEVLAHLQHFAASAELALHAHRQTADEQELLPDLALLLLCPEVSLHDNGGQPQAFVALSLHQHGTGGTTQSLHADDATSRVRVPGTLDAHRQRRSPAPLNAHDSRALPLECRAALQHLTAGPPVQLHAPHGGAQLHVGAALLAAGANGAPAALHLHDGQLVLEIVILHAHGQAARAEARLHDDRGGAQLPEALAGSQHRTAGTIAPLQADGGGTQADEACALLAHLCDGSAALLDDADGAQQLLKGRALSAHAEQSAPATLNGNGGGPKLRVNGELLAG